jgi:type VI secretion system secreted protein VgrG
LIPLTFAAGAIAAPPVPLGSAANFSILAGAAITNVPTSVISGDVGLSPAAGSFVAGLTCGEVAGTIYAVDVTGLPCFISNAGLLTTAKNDLTNAFDNAAGATPTQDITGVNLAGQTYGPGVYSATGDMLISGPVPLTLNGGGNADAVFIFKAAAGQNLTVGPTSSVIYTNGAQPCNVFWKVQSAFLANTGFGFVGTILALTQITLTSNITVQGRLLARNANVTLISDTITKPSTCVVQADVDAAAAAAAAAEAAKVEAARVAAVAAAARVTATKAALAKVTAAKAAAKKATAKKAAAVKAAAKRAAVTQAGGATSVSGPALPPVRTAGFTG